MPAVESYRADHRELMTRGAGYEEWVANSEKHADIIEWLEAHDL